VVAARPEPVGSLGSGRYGEPAALMEYPGERRRCGEGEAPKHLRKRLVIDMASWSSIFLLYEGAAHSVEHREGQAIAANVRSPSENGRH
jgi:hypothetical protein